MILIALVLWIIILTMIVFALSRKVNTLARIITYTPRIYEKILKIKSLKKKPRRRYIVFEIVSSEPITFAELDTCIKSNIRELLGILGSSQISYKLIEYDEKTKRGIIRTDSASKNTIIAVMGLSREISGKRILIIPLRITGTVKKARQLIRSTRTR